MKFTLPNYLRDLHSALLLVDDAPLECDGHTMMISNALSNASIPHERILGTVRNSHNEFCLYPHLWLKLDDYIIDYRLRMWLNVPYGTSISQSAPHGIFPSNYDMSKYLYEEIQIRPAKLLDNKLLSMITDGYSDKLTIPQSVISRYKG